MKEIRFGPLVALSPQGESIVVGGRVLKGPISVGDRFTRMVLGAETIELRDVTVERISIYGTDLASVEEVLTPNLTLVGADVSQLRESAEITG